MTDTTEQPVKRGPGRPRKVQDPPAPVGVGGDPSPAAKAPPTWKELQKDIEKLIEERYTGTGKLVHHQVVITALRATERSIGINWQRKWRHVK